MADTGVTCLNMKRSNRPADPDARLDSSVPVPAAAQSGPISHAIFRVARLHRMIAGHLLREVGLHPGQEIVMMHLWQAGPQRQADLVRVLDSDAATMTRTIRRLETAGFVRRVPTPADKRAWLIEPTPASIGLRQRVEDIWAELEDAAVSGLGAAQRQTIEQSLLTLEARLSRAADTWLASR
jgi:MarR family transcriptional regulator, organic hydroperoxide resistance regulator